MIKVGIVGSGRVAYHLAKGFLHQITDPEVQLAGVFARNASTLASFLPPNLIFENVSSFENVDVIIIAVSDDVIQEFSAALPFSGKLVAHTSGSTPLEALSNHNRKGVFYPLQTFSKEKNVIWQEVPIALEATLESDYITLQKIAATLSGNVLRLNSEQRVALHTAAVFVANFVNHMYVLGYEICQKNNMPFDLLKPLIHETAAKIALLSPKEAQTGPALRFDHKTIERHKELLHAFPEGLNVYTLITQSIQNIHSTAEYISRK